MNLNAQQWPQQRHRKPIQEVLNPGSEWEMATGFNKENRKETLFQQ